MDAIETTDDTPNRILRQLTPAALVDFMLLELVARGHGTLLLEPRAGAYDLSFDGGATSLGLASLEAEQAQAAIARLSFIAEIALEPPRVARLAVRLASHRGAPDEPTFEVLLSTRAADGGVALDVHALAMGRALTEVSPVAGLAGVAAPRPGEVKYQVLGELGRGGMGIVYRARHVLLDKEVALKVLHPAMAQRRAFSAQFVVEARAACRARHPAIIDVTDFGQLSDGRNFLVMECLDWPTLDARLAGGGIATPAALTIALGIAQGLEAAHRHGVVHRDLKPSNIFVSDDDRVKIGDFGLAHSLNASDDPSPLGEVFFGTVPYMAPELIRGGDFDHRADLYAFGCILHELLEGAPPYASENSAEILERHEHAPIPALGAAAKQLPALGGLHQRLLAKQPEDRPADFTVVIAELDALLRSLA